MSKYGNPIIGIDHLSTLSNKSESFRSVYQLQFNSLPDTVFIEGPLFLNLSENHPDAVVEENTDFLFSNQLKPPFEKEV